MTIYLRTKITQVGKDVKDLIEGGVLILFADGAPAELAEVSVLHNISEGPIDLPPSLGSKITIGDVSATLTGLGDLAWNKIRDIGHVVINFNGGTTPERPGEINASTIDLDSLITVLKPGNEITIKD